MDTEAAKDSRGNDSQLELLRDSGSIWALMQSSSRALENECLNLESIEREEKRELKELEETSSRLAINISKQKLDLQHLMVKTYNEAVNKESDVEKFSNLRKKSQQLNKYIGDWSKCINLKSFAKENLMDYCTRASAELEPKRAHCNQLEKEFKHALDIAKQGLNEVSVLRERERIEFDEIKRHLENQLNLDVQKEKELQDMLRELDSEYKEMNTVKDMLTVQNNELKKTLEHAQNVLMTESSKVKSSTEQIRSLLQEELNKKDGLISAIKATEKTIDESNNVISNKNIEIDTFDSRLKQLIAEEEDLNKVYTTEMEVLAKMQTDTELLKGNLSILLGINDENVSLKRDMDTLEQINKDYETKIIAMDKVEDAHLIELNEVKKLIEELELKRSTLINEQLAISDEVKKLQKKMEDDSRDHEQLSNQLDEHYVKLIKEQDSLNDDLDVLAEKLQEASEDKKEFERVIQNLKKTLKQTKEICNQKETELFSSINDWRQIEQELKEKSTHVEEMIFKTQQDYAEAESNLKINEEHKKEIIKLENILQDNRTTFAQSLDQLKDCHSKQIETKNRLMADLRIEYEREYRNKEQSKTDDMVELKETKMKITNLKQQKEQVENELKKFKNISMKSDIMLRKLGSKLNMAHKATTPSQSTMVPSSQMSNLSNASPMSRKNLNECSPSSDSSGLTFNPDEVDLKNKNIRNAFNVISRQSKPNTFKKYPPTKPTKKKDYCSDKDDWGF